MTVTLRPEEPGDNAFLRRLMMETAAEELGAAAWPAAVREHLMGIQCSARLAAPRAHYPAGQSAIIVVDGADAGWLYTASLPEELRLVEIMLLRERRGAGAGTAVLRQLMAAAGDRTVRLFVNVMNERAVRFYERLGFARVGGDAVQHLMESRAGSAW